MRLNKFIAHSTGRSRREADRLIESGRVHIDGHQALLGERVNSDSSVTIDGVHIALQSYRYIRFHKPVGVVSSRANQNNEKTVYDLLPKDMHTLKIIGRLDKNSEGLLLLSNDGDFAHNVQHPSKHIEKEYEVWTDTPITADDLAHIRQGVEIVDGVSSLTISKHEDHYRIHMHEGRNRQIRRTIGALNYNVVRLKRLRIGNIALEDLQPGSFEEFDPKKLYNEN